MSPRRPKACHLSSVHSPRDQRILYKECVTLASAGYDVSYVCPGREASRVGDVKIRCVVAPQGGRLERMSVTVARVVHAAIQERADIYHVHDPELLPAAALLSSLGHFVIYDAHEDLPRDMEIKTYLPTWMRRLLAGAVHIAEPSVARLVDAVVVPVDYMRNRFEQFGVVRVTTLHNYPLQLPAETERPGSRSSDVRVVYVGHLSVFRGIESDVKAMGHLADDVPARLLLYGACDPPDLLERLSHDPGFARTDYHGVLDHSKLPRVLATADIGVATLLRTDAYTRTIPTKVYEYLSAGLPVIVSDFPLWRQFVEQHDCGICVDPADPSAIAAAIARLSKDPDERRRMGDNGRRASSLFCWEREAEKLLALYSDLLGGGAPPSPADAPHSVPDGALPSRFS